jgi:hypothetical protein
LEEGVLEDDVREPPRGFQRFERDMNRPERPRRRDRICSFQVLTLRSMLGIMDCVTSSRMKVRREEMSESGK